MQIHSLNIAIIHVYKQIQSGQILPLFTIRHPPQEPHRISINSYRSDGFVETLRLVMQIDRFFEFDCVWETRFVKLEFKMAVWW